MSSSGENAEEARDICVLKFRLDVTTDSIGPEARLWRDGDVLVTGSNTQCCEGKLTERKVTWRSLKQCCCEVRIDPL